MKISVETLKERILESKGASIVSIVTHTEPKMRKTGNPYIGRVVRVASRSGMLNVKYENAVNNQRAREGNTAEFKAESLWGGKGQHVSPSIVRHTTSGEEYLVFFPTRTTEDGKPIANKDLWLLDGLPMDEATLALVKPFLVESGSSDKQDTEKQISWRVIKLVNVKEVRIDGQVWSIV